MSIRNTALMLLLAVLGGGAQLSLAEDWRPVGVSDAETKVLQALQQPTTFEFIETPLLDIVEYFKDLHEIEIRIEHHTLAEVGIGSDTPVVTRNLKGVSLASALRIMLLELGLTYEVRDEVLLIISPKESEKWTTTEVYDVEPLISTEHKIDELADAVAKALGRRRLMPPVDAREIVGGTKPKEEPQDELAAEASVEEEPAPRGIAVYRNFLIVTDSGAGQRQVQRLLGRLGVGLQTRAENGIR